MSVADLERVLMDPWKRLCSLYWIIDDEGNEIPFKPKPEQERLYREAHNLNIVLKARQKGFTTVIQLMMLDDCLFNRNIEAGVIAHTRDDAERFFRRKIRFAYDRLPEAIREHITASTDSVNELTFSNGSSIRVGTSLRSSTLQWLHISEFGKICAKYPDKAREIVTGSLNTVRPGQRVFIESTAESGHYGKFFEMCREAETRAAQIDVGTGPDLNQIEYKFFFFPWWTEDKYRLDEPVPIDSAHAKYFAELEAKGIKLDQPQQFWYVAKSREQGSAMLQEYPSTSDEAFYQDVEGLIFGKQMAQVRREGRITRVPYTPGHPVLTFWDLGRNDEMAIWFYQRIGFTNRFIDYHHDSGWDLEYYVGVLKDRKYVYGEVYLPHDANVTDLSRSDNLSRAQVLRGHGMQVIVVPRVLDKRTSIEMARQVLPSCWFDEERCTDGIQALEAYCYKWNERAQTTHKIPAHNWASNGADAFQQFGLGYRSTDSRLSVKNEQLARRRKLVRSRTTGTSVRI